MVVSGVSNLVWMDSAHTVFDCVLATDTLGSIPFSCSMHDTNELAVQLWADAVTNNKYGAIGAYVAPAVNLIQAATLALYASDKTILRCVENAVAVPAAWATYRAALRNIISTGTGTMPTRPAYPSGT